MDVEDRRRYFIVGSVILEIVQPLFRARLEKDCSNKGLGSFQAFLCTLQVLHILFHLRHRNAYCCKDNINCRNNSKLPLIYCQWDLLYTENPGQSGHNCHCKFIANPVQLTDLDITLASLILLNCCHLGTSEENAIRKLRRYKNDYLSHNTEGKINETEYKSLWKDLTYFVIQLDPNKQDDLIRIEKRPLDEGLCIRYSIDLLNIHKKLNEMGTQIQGISSGMQMMGPQIQGTSSRLQVIGPQIQGISSGMQMMVPQIQGITSVMQELLSYQRNEATCQYCKKTLIEQGMDERKINSYKLGQDIFYQHGEIDLKSLFNENYIERITDVVIMDDGRLVMCLYCQSRLLICNTDGSEEAAIPVKGIPCSITAVNNFTVAVAILKTSIIQRNTLEILVHDIYNKHKLKSIPVPGLVCYGITMIKKQIVVGVDRGLLIVDYLTGEILQNIETRSIPLGIHSSSDKIFFDDYTRNTNNLHWYSFTDDNIHTLTLPSVPRSMTTLRDGSLYVLCKDRSVQHVSTDVKQFKTLKTNQSKDFSDCHKIRYNSKQKKMVTLNRRTGIVKILHEL
ncbi:Hypothetical predicted protein [Mytilus galloprovincialis]|uniref:DZIP3-like HEPN domain-containing protein n=1 Tax=Mytilus galloprovincialis TaxID=29158 RepID=A0A8B6BUP5_MYTGA|nr:Hypothetical predicted protein [Mytilus galloprovincialis]